MITPQLLKFSPVDNHEEVQYEIKSLQDQVAAELIHKKIMVIKECTMWYRGVNTLGMITGKWQRTAENRQRPSPLSFLGRTAFLLGLTGAACITKYLIAHFYCAMTSSWIHPFVFVIYLYLAHLTFLSISLFWIILHNRALVFKIFSRLCFLENLDEVSILFNELHSKGFTQEKFSPLATKSLSSWLENTNIHLSDLKSEQKASLKSWRWHLVYFSKDSK